MTWLRWLNEQWPFDLNDYAMMVLGIALWELYQWIMNSHYHQGWWW